MGVGLTESIDETLEGFNHLVMIRIGQPGQEPIKAGGAQDFDAPGFRV
jgi:hypothetical protein